jgi:molecular chaperone GrpE
VVNVMQKGWMLHDRVLRPAMVVVARAPSGDTGGDLAGNP